MWREFLNTYPKYFWLIVAAVMVVGLTIGVLITPKGPPVGKGVGHMEREASEPYLFDPPLKKGIENLPAK